MVNLLKCREHGGLESHQRYAHDVSPHLARVGATVRYGGTAPVVVLGDGTKPWWDAILLVEYPTPAAFAVMVTHPGYADVHRHRADALERGDLIATSEWVLGP